MAILEDLHTSISAMSDDELNELFRQVRLSRRTSFSTHQRKKLKKKPPKLVTPPSVSSISPDLAAQLLKTLGA